jgi:hypothetical protein
VSGPIKLFIFCFKLITIFLIIPFIYFGIQKKISCIILCYYFVYLFDLFFLVALSMCASSEFDPWQCSRTNGCQVQKLGLFGPQRTSPSFVAWSPLLVSGSCKKMVNILFYVNFWAFLLIQIKLWTFPAFMLSSYVEQLLFSIFLFIKPNFGFY